MGLPWPVLLIFSYGTCLTALSSFTHRALAPHRGAATAGSAATATSSPLGLTTTAQLACNLCFRLLPCVLLALQGALATATASRRLRTHGSMLTRLAGRAAVAHMAMAACSVMCMLWMKLPQHDAPKVHAAIPCTAQDGTTCMRDAHSAAPMVPMHASLLYSIWLCMHGCLLASSVLIQVLQLSVLGAGRMLASMQNGPRHLYSSSNMLSNTLHRRRMDLGSPDTGNEGLHERLGTAADWVAPGPGSGRSSSSSPRDSGNGSGSYGPSSTISDKQQGQATAYLSAVAACLLLAVGCCTLLLPRAWLVQYTGLALPMSFLHWTSTSSVPQTMPDLAAGAAVQRTVTEQWASRIFAVLLPLQLPIAYGLVAVCMHVPAEAILVELMHVPAVQRAMRMCYAVACTIFTAGRCCMQQAASRMLQMLAWVVLMAACWLLPAIAGGVQNMSGMLLDWAMKHAGMGLSSVGMYLHGTSTTGLASDTSSEPSQIEPSMPGAAGATSEDTSGGGAISGLPAACEAVVRKAAAAGTAEAAGAVVGAVAAAAGQASARRHYSLKHNGCLTRHHGPRRTTSVFTVPMQPQALQCIPRRQSMPYAPLTDDPGKHMRVFVPGTAPRVSMHDPWVNVNMNSLPPYPEPGILEALHADTPGTMVQCRKLPPFACMSAWCGCPGHAPPVVRAGDGPKGDLQHTPCAKDESKELHVLTPSAQHRREDAVPVPGTVAAADDSVPDAPAGLGVQQVSGAETVSSPAVKPSKGPAGNTAAPAYAAAAAAGRSTPGVIVRPLVQPSLASAMPSNTVLHARSGRHDPWVTRAPARMSPSPAGPLQCLVGQAPGTGTWHRAAHMPLLEYPGTATADATASEPVAPAPATATCPGATADVYILSAPLHCKLQKVSMDDPHSSGYLEAQAAVLRRSCTTDCVPDQPAGLLARPGALQTHGSDMEQPMGHACRPCIKAHTSGLVHSGATARGTAHPTLAANGSLAAAAAAGAAHQALVSTGGTPGNPAGACYAWGRSLPDSHTGSLHASCIVERKAEERNSASHATSSRRSASSLESVVNVIPHQGQNGSQASYTVMERDQTGRASTSTTYSRLSDESMVSSSGGMSWSAWDGVLDAPTSLYRSPCSHATVSLKVQEPHGMQYIDASRAVQHAAMAALEAAMRPLQQQRLQLQSQAAHAHPKASSARLPPSGGVTRCSDNPMDLGSSTGGTDVPADCGNGSPFQMHVFTIPGCIQLIISLQGYSGVQQQELQAVLQDMRMRMHSMAGIPKPYPLPTILPQAAIGSSQLVAGQGPDQRMARAWLHRQSSPEGVQQAPLAALQESPDDSRRQSAEEVRSFLSSLTIGVPSSQRPSHVPHVAPGLRPLPLWLPAAPLHDSATSWPASAPQLTASSHDLLASSVASAWHGQQQHRGRSSGGADLAGPVGPTAPRVCSVKVLLDPPALALEPITDSAAHMSVTSAQAATDEGPAPTSHEDGGGQVDREQDARMVTLYIFPDILPLVSGARPADPRVMHPTPTVREPPTSEASVVARPAAKGTGLPRVQPVNSDPSTSGGVSSASALPLGEGRSRDSRDSSSLSPLLGVRHGSHIKCADVLGSSAATAPAIATELNAAAGDNATATLPNAATAAALSVGGGADGGFPLPLPLRVVVHRGGVVVVEEQVLLTEQGAVLRLSLPRSLYSAAAAAFLGPTTLLVLPGEPYRTLDAAAALALGVSDSALLACMPLASVPQDVAGEMHVLLHRMVKDAQHAHARRQLHHKGAVHKGQRHQRMHHASHLDTASAVHAPAVSAPLPSGHHSSSIQPPGTDAPMPLGLPSSALASGALMAATAAAAGAAHASSHNPPMLAAPSLSSSLQLRARVFTDHFCPFVTDLQSLVQVCSALIAHADTHAGADVSTSSDSVAPLTEAALPAADVPAAAGGGAHPAAAAAGGQLQVLQGSLAGAASRHLEQLEPSTDGSAGSSIPAMPEALVERTHAFLDAPTSSTHAPASPPSLDHRATPPSPETLRGPLHFSADQVALPSRAVETLQRHEVAQFMRGTGATVQLSAFELSFSDRQPPYLRPHLVQSTPVPPHAPKASVQPPLCHDPSPPLPLEMPHEEYQGPMGQRACWWGRVQARQGSEQPAVAAPSITSMQAASSAQGRLPTQSGSMQHPDAAQHAASSALLVPSVQGPQDTGKTESQLAASGTFQAVDMSPAGTVPASAVGDMGPGISLQQRAETVPQPSPTLSLDDVSRVVASAPTLTCGLSLPVQGSGKGRASTTTCAAVQSLVTTFSTAIKDLDVATREITSVPDAPFSTAGGLGPAADTPAAQHSTAQGTIAQRAVPQHGTIQVGMPGQAHDGTGNANAAAAAHAGSAAAEVHPAQAAAEALTTVHRFLHSAAGALTAPPDHAHVQTLSVGLVRFMIDQGLPRSLHWLMEQLLEMGVSLSTGTELTHGSVQPLNGEPGQAEASASRHANTGQATDLLSAAEANARLLQQQKASHARGQLLSPQHLHQPSHPEPSGHADTYGAHDAPGPAYLSCLPTAATGAVTGATAGAVHTAYISAASAGQGLRYAFGGFTSAADKKQYNCFRTCALLAYAGPLASVQLTVLLPLIYRTMLAASRPTVGTVLESPVWAVAFSAVSIATILCICLPVAYAFGPTGRAALSQRVSAATHAATSAATHAATPVTPAATRATAITIPTTTLTDPALELATDLATDPASVRTSMQHAVDQASSRMEAWGRMAVLAAMAAYILSNPIMGSMHDLHAGPRLLLPWILLLLLLLQPLQLGRPSWGRERSAVQFCMEIVGSITMLGLFLEASCRADRVRITKFTMRAAFVLAAIQLVCCIISDVAWRIWYRRFVQRM